MIGGNALIRCLICVGEISGAEMLSDFKGLEELRETPIKRQGEGNVDKGGDYAGGVGETSETLAQFCCEAKSALRNKVCFKKTEKEEEESVCS